MPKVKEHVNFYENLREAQMRLLRTYVMYADEPHFVIAITNHKGDGVFRVYLQPLASAPSSTQIIKGSKEPPLPNYGDFSQDDPSLGTFLDAWLDKNPNSPIKRKRMDSSYFNKFRPFPLGMCNYGTQTYFLERQPTRHTEQGLTARMVTETPVLLSKEARNEPRYGGTGCLNYVRAFSQEFYDCVKGVYHKPQECLNAMKDPEVENSAAAFDRMFAFVRGPMDMVFLAYKTDVIGVLPDGTLDSVRIGKEFAHTKEVVEGLKLFNNVIIK